VAPAILEDRDERVLICGPSAGLYDVVTDACWVVERSFLRAEIVKELRGWWEERGVYESVCDEQSLCKVAHSILNEGGQTDESKSARGMGRGE
jgi:hypothetical protein